MLTAAPASRITGESRHAAKRSGRQAVFLDAVTRSTKLAAVTSSHACMPSLEPYDFTVVFALSVGAATRHAHDSCHACAASFTRQVLRVRRRNATSNGHAPRNIYEI